jgi:hypothetical protein
LPPLFLHHYFNLHYLYCLCYFDHPVGERAVLFVSQLSLCSEHQRND